MLNRKVTSVLLGLFLLVLAGTVYAFPPRVSWIPAELKPSSTAPGESAAYTVTLKHTGLLPIPATNQLKVVAEGGIASFLTINQPSFPPVFKRGNQVIVSVVVSVPLGTPMSVRSGTLVLQRILPNGKVKEVWRADELPVELTFSSIPLPPHPGEDGKATLEGIDSDGDGVRDDIQRYIVLTYPESEKIRAALTQITKVDQAALIDANDRNASVRHAKKGFLANDCLYFVVGNSDRTNTISSLLQAEILNTKARSFAYITHNEQLGGEVFPMLRIGQARLGCNFNPDDLEN